ncbi:MAG TPA: sulfatase-like hydrolase/transferase [Pirellulales bacterium]|nr:sulfatase-like hydrolase/transferase [Pirellulales bacterium]
MGSALFLGLAFAWVASASLVHAADDASAKPNVVLILADDLGWTDLGCYGSDLYETPHLDRLAKEAMSFTQNYAACTVCSPTRAALLTGKYPARLHITDWIPGLMPSNPKLLVPDWTKYLPAEEKTLADAFKAAGYATASIGKWHLGDRPYWPDRHGFDLNLAGTDAASPQSYFAPWHISTLTEGADGEYLTDRLGEEAVKFIERSQDRPFFLYLPHFAVHISTKGKVEGPADLVDKYRDKLRPGLTHSNAEYAAMVESMDATVGRIRSKLNELGLAERTIIVFTSDNGGRVPTTSNKPLRFGKASAYEGGVRTPLIVHWPGVTKPGSVSNAAVITMDVHATLVEMCGLPKAPQSDGVSLAPLLRQSGELKRDAIFWHYPHHQWYQLGGATPYGAIRAGDFKLIEFFNDLRVELYNVREDIGEQHDLAAAMPEKVDQLRARLHAWREEIGAQMPRPNPDYDPSQPEAQPKKQRKQAAAPERTLPAWASHKKMQSETIPGPPQASNRGGWIAQLKHWRQTERERFQYDARDYERPETLWTQRSLVQSQMMVEDRYFYDPESGKYTVDRYLDDLQQRYGGVDSVLVWPVYPNVGIDNRNQLDMLRDLPGGIAGVRKMVDDFHRRGVRVMFPVMPWEADTREEGKPLAEAAALLMKQVGADGINGDTMAGLGVEYRQAAERLNYPLALEPEWWLGDQAMTAWNTMSWGYWKYQQTPVVSRYKWFEPRHMVHVCERWARDRTDGLQSAFFNGVGYESWENVWGIWNQFTQRDAETLRRTAAIERAVADLLTSDTWRPHATTLQPDVYASRFPRPERTAWLLVNRSPEDRSGKQLRVQHHEGARYYDLWHGEELKPEVAGKWATLSFEIEGRGYGAVLIVTNGPLPEAVAQLLPRMAELAKTRLSDLSAEWKALPQQIVEIAPSRPVREPPPEMVRIPAGKFRFKVEGVEIEGGDEPGVDVQYPWEDLPRRFHEKELELKAFFIDKYPVTNAQFKEFLTASGYRPKDEHNFLKDWRDGDFPPNWEKKPVTWVSLEDARAYAAWAGKRLPHEWEWQYAAQGADGRLYPWGNDPNPAAQPQSQEGPELREPTDVDAFPQGASPFGVIDMTGNVWQWTDEFRDEHTRAAIVRGGGYYRPGGSKWYFPRNDTLAQHGKYLLMAPSKDRSAMIGFRCVADAE